jgi:arginine repressor
MNTLRVEILDPRATKLLRDLEELNLISIEKSKKSRFVSLLNKLRNNDKSAPSLSEITKEVESVRAKRNARK